MRVIIIIFSLLFFLPSFAQTTSDQEKIKNYIDTYFSYDRENIHVQFNKNIYVNTEDLAFKGYVWSKNNNIAHSNTTNVQLIIYNEQQEIVQKQLLFANKGTFSGGIHLNDKFKNGKYYFHFFTNWMNNFTEDDSFLQTIEIIDKNETYNLKTNEPNWKTATVSIFPEGGTIISDINNSVGISIKDCNQKGIEIKEGVIIDSKSNEVSSFHTNKMGNGAFYFTPNINETYTLKIKSEKLTLSQPLPKTKETGIIVTYNNNLPKNKLIVAVKTNTKGLELYQNKKFILLIQQNRNLIQQEITFKNGKTDQTLIVDKKYLPEGVNSIRLIDENLNQITERLVYINAINSPITTFETKNITKDSIAIVTKTEINQADLSVSILPENNACVTEKRSIIGTFNLNGYLENPEINNYVYFDTENENRKQDLELLLLNQTNSKFHWENIKLNPPKINYTFDKGVTISGKVEQKPNSNTQYKIALVSSKNNLFEKTDIDAKNDFKFENLYAQDSTVVFFQMVNEKSISVDTKMQTRVASKETKFQLDPRFEKTNCPIEKITGKTFTFSTINLEDKTINLAEVSIKSESKKNALIHKKDMSGFATAFKIKENDFGRLLDFLNRNGYKSGINPETGEVFIRSNRMGNGVTPSVFIDNDLVLDNNQLFNLYMNEIDEVYIDQSGSSDTYNVGNGTIKIFLKKLKGKDEYFKTKYASLIVTRAFAPTLKYKISQFPSTNENAYFGTLNWSPNIILKEDPNFEIKLPKSDNKEIQVLLEGFSEDGKLISLMKKIPVLNP
ncbi:hypothetical protein [Flavobacterium eburneipallidum]|uniref:hypothetical protein n=1 Tax=Flavobacterium eburneipallidum TaxID=3003263 RepID=UPI002483217C|nr:hypothetical protein [Flavobacterium eburneipallidum]